MEKVKRVLPYGKAILLGLNVLVIMLGYKTCLQFQSTTKPLYGYLSIALTYFFFGIFQFIAPTIIQYITPKYALLIGGLCYTFYIGTNIKFIPALYLVASAVCGVGSALLWPSSTTLLSGYDQNVNHPAYNYSFFYVPTYFNFLGNVVPIIIHPENTFWMFLVLTIICAIGSAVTLIIFNSPPTKILTMCELITATLRQFKNWRLAMIFPIAMVFGVTMSLNSTTLPVIASIDYVAYASICMGVCMVIATSIWGVINRRFGDQYSLLISVIFEILTAAMATFVNEYYLHNNKEYPTGDAGFIASVCVCGCLIGIANSGIEVCIGSFINLCWPKQVAPMCCWRVVYIITICTALVYSAFIEIRIVLILVFVVCFFGLIDLIIIIILFKKVFTPEIERNHQKLKDAVELEGNENGIIKSHSESSSDDDNKIKNDDIREDEIENKINEQKEDMGNEQESSSSSE